MAKARSRWKTYKEIIPEEDSTPKQITHKGKLLSSPRQIANAYADYLDKKLEDLRGGIKQTNMFFICQDS